MRGLVRPLLLICLILAVPVVPFLLWGAPLEAAFENWFVRWTTPGPTALLIVASHAIWSDWPAIAAEPPRHRSPNAGWPEAAMARALGVALSGPRTYHGVLTDFPYVNETGRKDIGAPEVDAACRALWRVWAGALGLAILLAFVFH